MSRYIVVEDTEYSKEDNKIPHFRCYRYIMLCYVMCSKHDEDVEKPTI